MKHFGRTPLIDGFWAGDLFVEIISIL